MAAVTREFSSVREPALWQAVGNTPLLPASSFPAARGRLWLKAEWLNPGGSVKDRAARAILRDALRRGRAAGPAAARCVERQHRDRLRHAGRRRRRRGHHLPSGQRQPRAPGAARGLRRGGRARPTGWRAPRAPSRRARELAAADARSATSTPTSTAIRPTRRRTARPPAPRSGRRPAAGSRTSSRRWARREP